MKARRDGITRDELISLFDYNAETGNFTWRKGMFAGQVAGCKTTAGYNRITIHKREYRCARLAWLYMTGEWPVDEVDHRDRNKQNDSWANLRAATRVQNGSNRSFNRSNTSGFKGVIWLKHRKKYVARINHYHKTTDVGYSHDPKEAALFYDEAARRLYGEFAKTNFTI